MFPWANKAPKICKCKSASLTFRRSRHKPNKPYAFRGFNIDYKIQEEILPEYIYAGKNVKPHTRIYGMGISTHGGLGVKNLLQPVNRTSTPYKYMQRPLRLKFAEINEVIDMACGYGFTVFAVHPNSKVPSCFGTGLASYGQIGTHRKQNGNILETIIDPLPIPIPLMEAVVVSKVACGRAHTLVQTSDNCVWTFGDNAYGQCGYPVTKEDHREAYYHEVRDFKDKSIQQMECGSDTSFVLCDGTVYSCGWNADSQAGRNTLERIDTFGPVEGDIKGEYITKVAASGDCVLALNDKGQLFGWGNSEYNQLALITDEMQVLTPSYLPVKLPKIVDVSVSATACYVVTEDGDLYSWGYGTLGRGPSNTYSMEPQIIPSTLFGRNILNKDSKVVEIFTGLTMAAAVTNEGGLYTWGRNTGGCLGLGDTKNQYFPLRVSIAGFVKKVSCGVDHMMVMAKSVI